MTSLKDPIQSLIAEIDGILHKPASRRPWSVSSEFAQQRQVLEQVRDYLSQQQKANDSFPSPQHEQSGQEVAQQIAQAVAKEMESLRANLMQPLQAELEALRRERESLVREIRQMENRASHHHSLAQQQARQQQIISDFLQALTGRLQESLTQVMAKTMANLETQFLISEFTNDQGQTAVSYPATSKLEPSSATGSLGSGQPLHPQERLEQLRQMQAQSDQILMNLDSTIRVVLEALQRNVLGYQESLSQGVAKMHNLGQQSEVLFTALANRMTQQLGRESSALLQPPPQDEAKTIAEKNLAGSSGNNTQQSLPFPGMELSSRQQTGSEQRNTEVEKSSLKRNSPLNPKNWEVIKLNLDNLGGTEPIDSKESDDRTQDTQQSVNSEDVNQEVDDLYALLFGADLIETLEPNEFKSLTQGTAIATQQKSSEESSSFVDPLSTVTDSMHQSDALFAEPEEMATSTQLSSVAPPSLSLNDREDVLFYEEATPVSNIKADFTSPSILENSESGETISALTDLFDEEELTDSQERSSPYPQAEDGGSDMPLHPSKLQDSLFIVHGNESPTINNQIGNKDVASVPPLGDHGFSTEVVEDSYVPAPPEENLLVTAQSESELDIKLLLEQETLQQLSQELSSFESFEEHDVQGEKESLGMMNDSESIPDQISHSTPSLDTEDINSASSVSAFISTQASHLRVEAPEPLPAVTYELLAEDWENFALDYPNEETAFSTTVSSEAIADSSITDDHDLVSSMGLGLVDSENEADKQKASLPPSSQPAIDTQAPTSHQVDWNSDIFGWDVLEWEDLNWDLEEELGKESLSEWTLDEADVDFVKSMDFGLESHSQESKTMEPDKSDNQ